MTVESDFSDPSWPEILRAVQSQLQGRLHTALPGIVKAYDVATQTAEIQLAVQLDGVSVPPLSDVPVCWPGGAAGYLHVPLASGDTAMVLFSESDFSGWYSTGSVSAPAMLERHGLYAVAIPGLRRTPLTVTAGHVTLAATAMLHLGSDAATAFVALANLVDARLSTIQAAFDGHTHATAAAGPPTPPSPLPPSLVGGPIGTLATVAATKVKVI